MKEMDKLRILIPHWIEHNEDHANEFRKWANQAGEAAADILTAADQMVQVNKILEAALVKMGGPLEYHHEH
jgi:hypothetical protein